MPARPTTIIHINTHKFRAGEDACIAVRRGRSGRAKYVKTVVLRDQAGNEIARLEKHDDPLKCGARLWLALSDIGQITEE